MPDRDPRVVLESRGEEIETGIGRVGEELAVERRRNRERDVGLLAGEDVRLRRVPRRIARRQEHRIEHVQV